MSSTRGSPGRSRGALITRRSATRLGMAGVLVALVAGRFAGCSVSPAEQQASRDAWAARDAERAAECRRKNVGYVAGGCAAGGP